MKYEICKEIKVDGVSVWSTIAWTDVWMYAVQIVNALNAGGGQYAIKAETPGAATPRESKEQFN